MTREERRLRKIAKKAIGLLDLTNLNEGCTARDIEDLCRRAVTPHGKVAAICIWKEHVPQAKALLKGSGIRIATVVNFPRGGTDVDTVVAETRQAIVSGTDEIDLVLPYRALMAGADGVAAHMVKAVRKTCGRKAKLKVILETGELKDEKLIRKASRLAMEAGADFIKTSTGKVAVNATPDAAAIMLKEIRRHGRKNGGKVGLKPAGGIKTTQDAGLYLDLARKIMGKGWATPRTMRFGASGVLADLLATIDGDQSAPAGEGY